MKQYGGIGHALSMALANLLAEVNSSLEQPLRHRAALETKYYKKHKSLEKQLSSRCNWHIIQQRFSPNILALIPTGRDYSIQNYK